MEENRNFYNCAEAETRRIEGVDKTRSGGEDKMRSDKRQFFLQPFCALIKNDWKTLLYGSAITFHIQQIFLTVNTFSYTLLLSCFNHCTVAANQHVAANQNLSWEIKVLFSWLIPRLRTY